MKKTILLILAGIFVLGYFLRVIFLKDLAVTFSYDQARDAFSALQIVGGHLKILGPPASTQGLFHGVFYYYVLAPAYWLGHASPIVAAYWIAFLNALSVFLTFYLTYQVSKKIGVALLAALIFAVSFEAAQYATWLSNPTLGVWTVPLIYIGLWAWIKEKRPWAPALTALGLGLSIQSEIFLAYHILPLILWLWVGRKNVGRKSLLIFGGVFLLSISSMLIAEVKFGFKSIAGVKALLTNQDPYLNRRSLGDFIILYLNQFGRVFTNSVLPFNAGYGSLLGLGAIYWAYKSWKESKARELIVWQPFLATFVLAHLPIVSLGGVSSPFLTVGLGIAAIILTAMLIDGIWQRRKIWAAILAAVVILANIGIILSENWKGQTLFAIQSNMTIKYETQGVDYMYKEAGGKPFSINSITSPMWMNVTWSYLFNWYGKQKYGYLPEWHGSDQTGILGNNLPATSPNTSLYFLIIEPEDVPGNVQKAEIGKEDSKSYLLTETRFGGFIVQKRERIFNGGVQ